MTLSGGVKEKHLCRVSVFFKRNREMCILIVVIMCRMYFQHSHQTLEMYMTSLKDQNISIMEAVDTCPRASQCPTTKMHRNKTCLVGNVCTADRNLLSVSRYTELQKQYCVGL
jgi:hypothetical protein